MSKNFTPNSSISHPAESESSSEFIGNFFAVLLFAVAIIFLFVVCSHFSDQTTYEKSELRGKTRTNNSSVLVNQVQRVNQSPSQMEEDVTSYQPLSVSGIAEIGNNLAFTIETYSPYAEYSINFGDGNFQKVNSKTSYHQYRQVGQYDVQVKIDFKGKSKIISQRSIQIANAIQMKAKVAEMEY